MKAIFIKAKSMAKVFTDGKMEIYIMETFRKTKDKDLEYTNGVKVGSTKVSGGPIE